MTQISNLHIDATRQMPEVHFETNGKLQITGRAIPDDSIAFFNALGEWVQALECPAVSFDINLDYINTSASMQLFGLLRKLEENNSIKDLTVNWHYETDDEDHYDTGLFFEEKLERTTFFYTEDAA